MAKGKKTGGRDFKKGNQAAKNKGRIKHTELAKETRKLSQKEFVEEASFLCLQPVKFLKAIIKDVDNQPFSRAAIASLMLNIIKDGDYRRLEMLLNRIHGRVPLALSVSRGIDHPFQKLLDELSEDELRAMRAKVVKEQNKKPDSKTKNKEHVVQITNVIEV